jgi:hypothetical protein
MRGEKKLNKKQIDEKKTKKKKKKKAREKNVIAVLTLELPDLLELGERDAERLLDWLLRLEPDSDLEPERDLDLDLDPDLDLDEAELREEFDFEPDFPDPEELSSEEPAAIASKQSGKKNKTELQPTNQQKAALLSLFF